MFGLALGLGEGVGESFWIYISGTGDNHKFYYG